jgi:DNA topoisomerase-1
MTTKIDIIKSSSKSQKKLVIESSGKSQKKLVIIESPGKSQKIGSILGDDYIIKASFGHIRDLDKGSLSIDIENNFKPNYIIPSDKTNLIKELKHLAQSGIQVIIATDNDREGEGIAWHICQVFDLPIETTTRIVFHEITETAVKNAIKNKSYVNMNLVYAQQARQVLDIIVGFKISPFLWKHIHRSKKNVLSAGRCQTPALRLVYDNSKEISNFETRYKTIGHFFSQNYKFILNHDFETISEIETFLDQSKITNHKYKFSLNTAKESKRGPPKPFNTSRLLQSASNLLHTSPKQTMQLCQNLYQNGHITYMRTDNQKYAPAFLDNVRKYILEKYEKNNNTNNKYTGDLEILENNDKTNPHEAIRVTHIELKTLPENADPKESAMYSLIWKNTIESCMSDAKYSITTAEITAPKYKNKYLFYQHVVEIPIFLGWKIVNNKENVDENGNETHLNPSSTLLFFNNLGQNTKMDVPFTYIESNVVVRSKQSHYNEAGLINKLEELGIGRPSTFATIVDTIIDRGYVKKQDIKGQIVDCVDFKLYNDNILEKSVSKKEMGGEKSKLLIQPVGILCVEFLSTHFERLFSYGYTKTMEEELDKIANNNQQHNIDWYELCRKCFLEIRDLSKELENLSKVSYPIINDDNNNTMELVFQEFGPTIRIISNEPMSKPTYKSIKPGIEIDLEKAAKGEYKFQDLVAIDAEYLGEYQGDQLKVKTGKYGPYLEWGKNKQSIKTIGLENINYEVAVEYLNSLNNEGQAAQLTEDASKRLPPSINPKILRVLSSDISIRSGKFGPYIFYQTTEMKKPEFYPMKKCPYKYDNCETNDITKWIQNTYLNK